MYELSYAAIPRIQSPIQIYYDYVAIFPNLPAQ